MVNLHKQPLLQIKIAQNTFLAHTPFLQALKENSWALNSVILLDVQGNSSVQNDVMNDQFNKKKKRKKHIKIFKIAHLNKTLISIYTIHSRYTKELLLNNLSYQILSYFSNTCNCFRFVITGCVCFNHSTVQYLAFDKMLFSV
jgi:hypothetical protein